MKKREVSEKREQHIPRPRGDGGHSLVKSALVWQEFEEQSVKGVEAGHINRGKSQSPYKV